MEDQGQHDPNSPSHGSEKSEPVRSRWTPKPEQILILESIFNSGMVNPPKEETVRIRKLLEKFGTVGDANVFYWFQNRRSRSRRRQRQLQASLEQSNQMQPQVGGAIPCDQNQTTFPANTTMGFGSGSGYSSSFTCSSQCFLPGSSSSCGVVCSQENMDGFFSVSPQMGFPEIDHSSAASSVLYPSVTSNLNYESGFITVFINGIATELPKGPIDIKTVFGDVMLVHSSGVPLPTNEFGFLMQSLQHGESYFLVGT
ncbi:WUSCHEL-related homeobox 11-like [Gastrolobium bilobum]|uniref:WUSCHEL-related homeobox 11-like n=1 Tax=Gastrolobium bilobum TaxID=150636 RepID=UPI002AB1124F|nr:WUSCHEL-related homeobox 11-like [Gastrolobium bilobum]